MNSVPQSGKPLVLHVIDSLDISGGAERQLVANLRSFDQTKIGHELVVIEPVQSGRESALDGVVKITRLFADHESYTRVGIALRLRRLVREMKPDLIHASLPNASLVARVVGRLERVPIVESLVNISHEPVRVIDHPTVTMMKLRFHTILDRMTMTSVTAFHAVSEAVADSWSRTIGLERNRIRVIPRGVNLDDFVVSASDRARHRPSVLAEFGFPAETRLILSVGRVEPQKGHRYLVEALTHLVPKHPSIRLLIIGREGAASEMVRRTIKQHSLEGYVVLAGARRELPRFLAASDIFAFPSLFEGNGGNAMIEAMAAGLPIVTTGSAPMTDLIPDESRGRLVPPRDPGALAGAIDSLLANPPLAAELGSKAAEGARTLPSPDQVAAIYEAWYSELIGGVSQEL